MNDTRPGGHEGKEEKMMKAVKMVINSRKARRLVKAVREVSYPLSHQSFLDEEAAMRHTEGTDAAQYIDNPMYWEGYRNRCANDAAQELEWQLRHNSFSASQEAGLRQYA